MKVYLSTDIEGVAGITRPEEANPDRPDIKYFREQMSLEVAAACRGALKAGATEILVKDAHWNGCNIDPRALPREARILRGWTGHPYHMMQGLDESFHATMYVGYHSRAGSGGNPLAHTLSGGVVAELRINDVSASEFLVNTYTSTYLGVPVVFLSGDQGLCDEVSAFDPNIRTVATMEGVGTGTISLHPEVSVDRIEEVSAQAITNTKSPIIPNPESFAVELDYVRPRIAYGKSFYPGVEAVSDKTLRFVTNDYFEVLRFLHFCV